MTPEIPSIEAVDELLVQSQGLNQLEGLVVDGEFAIGRILIFSAFVGEELEQLAILSGLPVDSVQRISETLKKHGVFGSGIDHYKDYFSKDSSGLQLSADIACGKGWMTRTLKNGEPAYRQTPEGIKWIEENLLRGEQP